MTYDHSRPLAAWKVSTSTPSVSAMSADVTSHEPNVRPSTPPERCASRKSRTNLAIWKSASSGVYSPVSRMSAAHVAKSSRPVSEVAAATARAHAPPLRDERTGIPAAISWSRMPSATVLMRTSTAILLHDRSEECARVTSLVINCCSAASVAHRSNRTTAPLGRCDTASATWPSLASESTAIFTISGVHR